MSTRTRDACWIRGEATREQKHRAWDWHVGPSSAAHSLFRASGNVHVEMSEPKQAKLGALYSYKKGGSKWQVTGWTSLTNGCVCPLQLQTMHTLLQFIRLLVPPIWNSIHCSPITTSNIFSHNTRLNVCFFTTFHLNALLHYSFVQNWQTKHPRLVKYVTNSIRLQFYQWRSQD
jgi:hypothetical protein